LEHRQKALHVVEIENLAIAPRERRRSLTPTRDAKKRSSGEELPVRHHRLYLNYTGLLTEMELAESRETGE
jgi:hypothetical protein